MFRANSPWGIDICASSNITHGGWHYGQVPKMLLVTVLHHKQVCKWRGSPYTNKVTDIGKCKKCYLIDPVNWQCSNINGSKKQLIFLNHMWTTFKLRKNPFTSALRLCRKMHPIRQLNAWTYSLFPSREAAVCTKDAVLYAPPRFENLTWIWACNLCPYILMVNTHPNLDKMVKIQTQKTISFCLHHKTWQKTR